MLDKTTDPQEAIKIAIEKEREAQLFYRQYADLFENEGTRQMFIFLANEERKHEEKLQKELEENYLYEM